MLEREWAGRGDCTIHEFRFLVRSEWPWEIRQAIRKAADNDYALDERSLNCVRMYRAVICRAIADAYGKTGLEDPSERRTCIREAREFFRDGGEWFTFLFSCSGIDQSAILPHMLKLSSDEYQSLAPRKRVDTGGNPDIMDASTLKPSRRR